MILTTVAQRRALLDGARTVAMVGASSDPNRASYLVWRFLRRRGRPAVIPINPGLTALDGVPAYPTLAAYAAAHGPPDIVDVFRRPQAALGIAREAIAIGAPAIWFQYGVIDATAIATADAAGLDVVVDRCIKVEAARFDGGLAIGGFNSGVITARRRAR